MKPINDFRTVELRIPRDRFPLPARVEEKLRLYAGVGVWEGDVAVFELAISRVAEVEEAFLRAAGDVR